MKRTNHARLVGIGREGKDAVDKVATPGRVFTAKELIDLQLRGVPIPFGESSAYQSLAEEMQKRELGK